MPSSTRHITSQAVRRLRDLRTALADRRCDDLLMVTAAHAIVRASEGLHAGVARLDEDLVRTIQDRMRAAIASLGTLDLQGDPFGVGQIKDDVGRLICERQLPNVYLCHLLAATITGVEQGLRDLLLGTTTTAVEQSSISPRRTKAPRRNMADRLAPGPATTSVAPAATSPIPDTAAADPLARLSSATATGSGSSSGRLEIEADTEGI